MKRYLYRIKNKIDLDVVLWFSICAVGLIIGFCIGFFYDKHRSFSQIKEFISISTQLGTFCTFLFLVAGKMKESIEKKEKARLVESSYNSLKFYEYLGKEKNDVINGSGDKRENVVRNILSNLDCIDRYSNNNIVKKYTFEFKLEFESKYKKDAELDTKLFNDLGYYLNSIKNKIRK
ncbi:hypothetical protein [Ligilactobacillus salivarius]|uniref:hypothetical protein n=1 Tax=Ligilactobacillus salivarius TaxID=1624 RepID=UPI0029662326|nr:hypothetical protein [Ligilactobacillus salivarius]MDW3023148.1 hypothetical protein [Ligilactobacillus salivarius]